jgi:catechol 2,3-dioxygenase-like lactoylglutathione lyase family enzyme
MRRFCGLATIEGGVVIGLKRIVHVNLVVEDVEVAKEFYGRLLGLQEIARAEGTTRPGVWYRLGDLELHIAYEAAPRNADSTRHIAFELADLDAARIALERAGAPIEAARPLPGLRRFFTRDPSGNRIELQEPTA